MHTEARDLLFIIAVLLSMKNHQYFVHTSLKIIRQDYQMVFENSYEENVNFL